MPELPEVETCKQGIAPHLLQQRIHEVIIRQWRLRLPIPKSLPQQLTGTKITRIDRRGKYLLFTTPRGTLLIHLGMSGSLRIATNDEPLKKHDHIIIHVASNKVLRYHDPRRFGICLWIENEVYQHPLLAHLGPEPLTTDFNSQYLFTALRSRKSAIKTAIMDSQLVVGVGNIYANEALYAAKISPLLPAHDLTQQQCTRLVKQIKSILAKAIKIGGTTLRDFVNGEGKPGYFKQHLQVYGRAGESCYSCQSILKEARISQRSTVFCPICQAIEV